MSKLDYNVWKSVNWLDRNKIVELLESVSICCYEGEPTQDLREALVANIEDGTIELPEEYQFQ